MAKFELFRLSLFGETGDLTKSRSLSVLSREEHLREAFGRNIEFTHRNKEYHFVPLLSDKSDYLIGRIGRKILSRENLPPSQGFEDTEHESWIALSVVIDPRDHEDGQKMAVQIDLQVGSPNALLRALVECINSSDIQRPFSIDAERIVDTDDFWRFAESQTITKITFDFIAPNMFGSADEMSEELRMLKDKTKARRVQLAIQNEEGLAVDSSPTRAGVEHASRGTGSFRARASSGQMFSSLDNAKRTQISDEKIDRADLANSLINAVMVILGRE